MKSWMKLRNWILTGAIFVQITCFSWILSNQLNLNWFSIKNTLRVFEMKNWVFFSGAMACLLGLYQISWLAAFDSNSVVVFGLRMRISGWNLARLLVGRKFGEFVEIQWKKFDTFFDRQRSCCSLFWSWRYKGYIYIYILIV